MNARMITRLFGTLVLGGVLLSGCVSPQSSTLLPSVAPLSSEWRPATGMADITYAAVDGMVAQLREEGRAKRARAREVILPASFVDDKKMDQSSAMGRLIAQQMASRFVQAGYPVVEIKLRRDISLRKDEGQFLLSRELEKVAETHRATTVLVGSYVESRNNLFVNSQLILLKDGVVLASQDFRIPITYELRALLAQGS